MITGDKKKFAIEVCPIHDYEDCVLGSFLFWINGQVIGNPEDHGVHLSGCMNWLKDFCSKDIVRFENGLYSMSTGDAWDILARSVLAGFPGYEEIYPNTFSRFHISHLGMSSFDCYTIILAKDEYGRERLIWQFREEDLQEAFLDTNCIEFHATEAVKWFEKWSESSPKTFENIE